MEHKRLTLFAGHYGSGKTNIAVNYACALADEGKKVCVADLDIVNPYFRTKDSEKEFKERGIELISSRYANTNVDLPAIPAESYRLVQDKSIYGVIDIGGDDRGAYALGRFADAIKEEGNYRMAFVLNRFRPLTSTVDDAVEIMREIEAASGIPFTAIVNNSNIGPETTSDVVRSSYEYANEVSSLTGLPIKFTSVASFVDTSELDGELLLLDLQKKII
jgi:cellulose biosynthesis protein BcsQ